MMLSGVQQKLWMMTRALTARFLLVREEQRNRLMDLRVREVEKLVVDPRAREVQKCLKRSSSRRPRPKKPESSQHVYQGAVES